MRKHRRLIFIILLSAAALIALLSYLNQPTAISVAMHTVTLLNSITFRYRQVLNLPADGG